MAWGFVIFKASKDELDKLGAEVISQQKEIEAIKAALKQAKEVVEQIEVKKRQPGAEFEAKRSELVSELDN